MKFGPSVACLALAAAAAPPLWPRVAQWWGDIEILASDANEGRLTGSPRYTRAADYVIFRFKAEGLEPEGMDGEYLQPVMLEQQTVDQAASAAALTSQTGRAVDLT